MSDSITPEAWTLLVGKLLSPMGLYFPSGHVDWGLQQLNILSKSLDISPTELVEHALTQPAEDKLCQRVCDSLLDNRSSFFSPYATYRFLSNTVIPDLALELSQARKMRIWCVGCAGGQEVYSLAIMLEVALPELKNWDIEILGTDVCGNAIRQANAGAFSENETALGLPPTLREHYFESNDSGGWVARKLLRRRIRFRQCNVLESQDHVGQVDLVFFRRVLGQLDPRVRQLALATIMRHAKPSTVLVLGPQELPPTNGFGLVEIEEGSTCWEISPQVQADMLVEASPKETRASEREVSEDDLEALKDLLSNSDLFQDLPPPLFDSICRKFELHEVQPGETVIRQGRRHHAFFVVFEGSLPVTFNRGFLRKPIDLGHLFPGAIFGEMSLLLNKPASATITADEPTSIFAGSGGLFTFLQERDKGFRDYVRELHQSRDDANVDTIAATGIRRAADAYGPGGHQFDADLCDGSLTKEAIDDTGIHPSLTRRLKLRGGTRLVPNDDDVARLAAMVREYRLFHGLEVGKIDAIVDQLQLWRFEQGARIVKENESGLGLYFLDRGTVQIEINRKMFKAGEAIQHLGPGACFGELSLFYGTPTTADVVTEGVTRIFVMGKRLYQLIATLNWDFREAISEIVRSRTDDNKTRHNDQ